MTESMMDDGDRSFSLLKMSEAFSARLGFYIFVGRNIWPGNVQKEIFNYTASPLI